MPAHTRFSVEKHGDVTELCLADTPRDELPLQEELSDLLGEFVETERPAKLLIRFALVGHCSSAAVNGLLRIRKVVDEYSGQLKLSEMSDDVRKTFHLLNLDDGLFEIHDTRADALATFSST